MRATVVLLAQIAGISVAIAVAGGVGLLASVVAFLLVIVVPGAILTRSLRSGDRLAVVSSTVLATGLGISLALAAGLILDRTPVPLTWLGPILLAVAISGLVWSIWRARRERPLRRLAADIASRYRIAYDEWVMLLIAVTLVTGALVISRANADPPLASGAQLWMVPTADSAEIGAANIGSDPVSWRLVAAEDGSILFDKPIALEPGQRWIGTMELPATHGAYTVSLLDATTGAPLREVRLSDGG